MEDILDSIANIISLIEDSIEDGEWELVRDAKQELEELYEELDKNSYKYEQYD